MAVAQILTNIRLKRSLNITLTILGYIIGVWLLYVTYLLLSGSDDLGASVEKEQELQLYYQLHQQQQQQLAPQERRRNKRLPRAPLPLLPILYQPKLSPNQRQYTYQAPLLPLIPGIDPWAQLRNRHAGERCLLIGNGPSLAKMANFSFVSSFNAVMGTNKINMGFQRFGFQPNYFATHNRRVIDQMRTEIIDGSLNPDIVKFIRSERWNGTDVENKENNIVLTSAISKCNDEVCRFPKSSVENGVPVLKYVNKKAECDRHCRNCFCMAHKHVVEGNTITYVSLQILFFMGCESVYLIGVDHNFIQDGEPNSSQNMTGDDPNHFDPNYFKGHTWDLADLESSELHYSIARDHYNFHHRQIRDATLGGHLTIFPKASHEELYSLQPQPLSAMNLPHIICRSLSPTSPHFRDPWFIRFPNPDAPIYPEFSTHTVRVLERIRQFSATICMNVVGLNFQPELTIVSSVFDSDEFIEGFLENAVSMAGFNRAELLMVKVPGGSSNEEVTIFEYMRGHPNIVLVKLDSDPKLYDLWNYSIRYLSRGRLFTNWNLDDRKPRLSLLKHMEVLQRHPDVDLVSSWVRVSSVANERFVESKPLNTWRLLPGPLYEMNNVAGMFMQDKVKGQWKVRNPPHNSPMWRASFHQRYGWFDSTLDPLSDWEFWLRSLIYGARYIHINTELELYYYNPKSYSIKARKMGLRDKAYRRIVLRYASRLPHAIVADIMKRNF